MTQIEILSKNLLDDLMLVNWYPNPKATFLPWHAKEGELESVPSLLVKARSVIL